MDEGSFDESDKDDQGVVFGSQQQLTNPNVGHQEQSGGLYTKRAKDQSSYHSTEHQQNASNAKGSAVIQIDEPEVQGHKQGPGCGSFIRPARPTG